MFSLYTLIVFAAMAAATVTLAVKTVRKGDGPFRSLYICLFFIAMFSAFLFKSGNTPQAVNAFVPLYKLFSINQYGYASILSDLLSFAVPFLAAGFLFMPAFPRYGLFRAFLIGGLFALAFNVYPLFNGASFVTDEYLFAGLGSLAGASIYSLLAYLFKKKLPLAELKLPVPLRRRYTASIVLCAIVYFGIAFVMIFDYGEAYAPIQFFDSETPLPKEMALECTLGDETGKEYVYVPTTQDITERATAVALAVDILMPVSNANENGIYIAQNDTGKVTMTENGSWVYEYLGTPEGDLPTKESAANAVFSFFAGKQILSVELDEITDIVERKDSATGAFIGYEVYISTSISGNPIIGSCSIVASVQAGDTIVKIRRYDGDILRGDNVAIISQQRAYEKMLAGDCAYTLFSPAVSAAIKSCELTYMANSSQGYYLPVWTFRCEAVLEDGSSSPFDVYVQAMK